MKPQSSHKLEKVMSNVLKHVLTQLNDKSEITLPGSLPLNGKEGGRDFADSVKNSREQLQIKTTTCQAVT